MGGDAFDDDAVVAADGAGEVDDVGDGEALAMGAGLDLQMQRRDHAAGDRGPGDGVHDVEIDDDSAGAGGDDGVGLKSMKGPADVDRERRLGLRKQGAEGHGLGGAVDDQPVDIGGQGRRDDIEAVAVGVGLHDNPQAGARGPRSKSAAQGARIVSQGTKIDLAPGGRRLFGLRPHCRASAGFVRLGSTLQPPDLSYISLSVDRVGQETRLCGSAITSFERTHHFGGPREHQRRRSQQHFPQPPPP